MRTKHTKGPWSLRRAQFALGWIVWGDGKRVASLQAEDDSDENTANALLLAAATELLAYAECEEAKNRQALADPRSREKLNAYGFDDSDVLARMRQSAIAKAKGETA